MQGVTGTAPRFFRKLNGVRNRKRQLRPSIETLEIKLVPAIVNPAAINLPIVAGLTPHSWTADSTGLYHTTTDLGSEWQANYQLMISGKGSPLTPTQRLEGNAEAVFENTGLKNLTTAQLANYREDIQ